MKIHLDSSGHPTPVIFPGASQKVSYTASSAQSQAINTTVIRLVSTTDCFVAIGENPTATTSDMFIPSGNVEFFAIQLNHKVSAIRSAADGDLYITAAQ